MDAERSRYIETIPGLRTHYNEKTVIFWGQLAKKVQCLIEKLTDFSGDLHCLALPTLPEGSIEFRDQLVNR